MDRITVRFCVCCDKSLPHRVSVHKIPHRVDLYFYTIIVERMANNQVEPESSNGFFNSVGNIQRRKNNANQPVEIEPESSNSFFNSVGNIQKRKNNANQQGGRRRTRRSKSRRVKKSKSRRAKKSRSRKQRK